MQTIRMTNKEISYNWHIVYWWVGIGNIKPLPSFFSWLNDVKEIWNIWKSDWSLKEQATLRWFVEGNPEFGWEFAQ
jgi:hypothetical protein